jgi:hypothetical protein
MVRLGCYCIGTGTYRNVLKSTIDYIKTWVPYVSEIYRN